MHPDVANGQQIAGVMQGNRIFPKMKKKCPPLAPPASESGTKAELLPARPNLPQTLLHRMDRAMARDPATAAYAWSRYRRVMRWLLAVAVALMGVALRLAVRHAESASIRRYVVAALCVGLAMLISSMAMGLWFLSRRRGAGENPLLAPRQSDAPE